MYLTDGHGSELLFNKKNKNEALSADRAWKFFDAKLSDVKVEDEGNTVDN